MSYFSADERLAAGASRAPTPAAAKRPRAEACRLFAADERLEAASSAATPPAILESATCPACGGGLQARDGWIECAACSARYLQVRGALVAAAALPLGACACCRPRQPLVQEHGRPLCPLSGRPHVLPADGHSRLADEAVAHAAPQARRLPGLEEIDAALAANSALLATHGVFVDR